MSTAELLFFVGTAVFAVTGVLGAARQNMDVMSFVIVGIVTAIGGGTLRDLMLDQPLFWLATPAYLYVASAAAVATFFFEQRFRAGHFHRFRLFPAQIRKQPLIRGTRG